MEVAHFGYRLVKAGSIATMFMEEVKNKMANIGRWEAEPSTSFQKSNGVHTRNEQRVNFMSQKMKGDR